MPRMAALFICLVAFAALVAMLDKRDRECGTEPLKMMAHSSDGTAAWKAWLVANQDKYDKWLACQR